MSVLLDVSAPSLVDLVGGLKAFRSDQLPYALSVGMNRAAKDAVQAIRGDLASVFELRSKSLVRTFGPFGRLGDTSRGWSNKSQWPRMRVTLHSQAHAMALQESGGVKPFRAREVWIPTRHVPLTATGRKPQRYQPARLKKRMANENQRGATRVFRTGDTVFERGRGEQIARPIYLIRRRAVVQPRLGFEEKVRRTYEAKLFPRFAEAMDKAIRTARRRSR